MISTILAKIAEAEKQQDRQFVIALARGLSILSALRFSPDGISYLQICELTKLPKATVSRLLYTLVKLQFLRQNPVNNLYLAGSQFMLLANSLETDCTLVEDIIPLLQQFAQEHKVSISMATEHFGEMRYIQSIRSPLQIGVQLQIGSLLPIAQSAIGRAYYAALADNDRIYIQQLLKKTDPTGFAQKLQTLEKQRHFFSQHGYSYSEKEYSPDISAIALVIKAPLAKHGIYALNASIPAYQRTMSQLIQDVSVPLMALAQKIEYISLINST